MQCSTGGSTAPHNRRWCFQGGCDPRFPVHQGESYRCFHWEIKSSARVPASAVSMLFTEAVKDEVILSHAPEM